MATRPVTRETVKALRKIVLAKCNGGDIARKCQAVELSGALRRPKPRSAPSRYT